MVAGLEGESRRPEPQMAQLCCGGYGLPFHWELGLLLAGACSINSLSIPLSGLMAFLDYHHHAPEIMLLLQVVAHILQGALYSSSGLSMWTSPLSVPVCEVSDGLLSCSIQFIMT